MSESEVAAVHSEHCQPNSEIEQRSSDESWKKRREKRAKNVCSQEPLRFMYKSLKSTNTTPSTKPSLKNPEHQHHQTPQGKAALTAISNLTPPFNSFTSTAVHAGLCPLKYLVATANIVLKTYGSLIPPAW